MPPLDPRRQLELVYAKNDLTSKGSLAAFLDAVVVDCRPTPRPFGQIAEDWQRTRNTWVVPAFEFVAGVRDDYTGPKNFWLGYSKGHDKSSYIARNLNWATAYARRPLRQYCCAKDSEQANVIYDAMRREAELNPWFAKRLEFKRNLVVGKDSGAKVEILASDAAGAHGKTPDVIVYDELCHWDSRDLYDSLQTASVKRGGWCLTMILTNAGFLDSWQWDERNRAKDDKDTFFYEQPVGVQLASWMRPEDIERIRKSVPEHEARRLFDNTWVDLSEAGLRFLPTSAIDRCIGFPEPPPEGASVVLGVDYGGTHDRTALAMVWYDGTVVHVSRLDCWQGSPDREIQIADVESWIRARLKEFPSAIVTIDKHQLIGTAQNLERDGYTVKRFEYRGGKGNALLAKHLRDLVTNRKLLFNSDAGFLNGETLASEMKQLVMKLQNYGERFDHRSGQHDDRTTAVAIAALEAVGTDPLPLPSRPPKPKEEPTHRSRLQVFVDEKFRQRGIYGLK